VTYPKLVSRWGLCALVALLTSAIPARAQGASIPVLLVLAKHDEKLAIIDPATLQVLATVPAGGNPHEVIASPDGRTAWISNYGNGSLHTITVVDLTQRRVEKTIDLGPIWGPHGLAFANGQVWFAAEREKLIGRIDPQTESIDFLLGTGQTGTHMLWVSRDGTQVVTANVGSGTMDIFQQNPVGPTADHGGAPSKAGGTTIEAPNPTPIPDWDQATIKVGGLANAKEGTISVIDFPLRKVIATIDAQVPTANRLKFTLNHRLALVSREKSGELTVLDVATRRVIKRALIGTGAAGILMDPNGQRAYVSCSPDNKVIVFDLKTFTVTGTIHPGQEPDGLAWAP
jgi:YVTN family beta-propeller protein